jgi:putative ABC transport system substrate-binding protein
MSVNGEIDYSSFREGETMNNKLVIWLMTAVLLTTVSPAPAQQPKNIPRIGYLTPSISANRSQFEAFRQGLRDLGYVEGKNFVIEWRASEGKLDRNPALAAELVRLKVDVIVAVGSGEIRAAKEATAAIPLSWCGAATLLEAVSLPVWRSREETLLDWQSFARS